MASPVSTEMGDFVAKILFATQQGSLAWEATADPDTMLAPLDGEYSVKIEQVEDLDGRTSEPDHILTLLKGRRSLFSLDRKDFENTDVLTLAFQREVTAYRIFKELWDRAYFKATKISDELDAVRKILDKKLR